MLEVGPYYKLLLTQELQRRCQKNQNYSLRAFARALEVDAGALSRLFAEKTAPSYKIAQKILTKIELSPADQKRFMNSVAEVHRARMLKRINPIFRSPAKTKANTQFLAQDVFETISDWYHYAILELSFTPRFSANPRSIAKQLDISISAAKLAIERLQRIGLMAPIDSKLKKLSHDLTIQDQQVSRAALRKRQRQILEKAIGSLENDPIEERCNLAMTMAIDPKKIPAAREMIFNFNQNLCEFLESGKRSRVFEIAVALFPLQKKESSQ